MGNTKRTVHIVANRDGIQQRVLSIREMKTVNNMNGLIISEPVGSIYEDYTTGLWHKTRTVSTSVHPSPEAVGHNIIDHIKLRGDADSQPDRYAAAAYVEFDASHPLWLVSAHVFAFSKTSPGIFRPRPGDEIINIDGLHENLSLCCLIWLSKTELPSFDVAPNKQVINFTIFRIYVDSYWLLVPATGFGYRHFIATSSRRNDGLSDQLHEDASPEALSISEAHHRQRTVFQKAANALYSNACREMGFNLNDLSPETEFLRLGCCRAVWKDGEKIETFWIADPGKIGLC